MYSDSKSDDTVKKVWIVNGAQNILDFYIARANSLRRVNYAKSFLSVV
jgi:hypothetical protein